RAQLWPWVPPLRSTVNDLACKCNNRNNRNNQTLFPGHRRTGLAVRAKNAVGLTAKFLERGHDDVLRNESVMVKCRPIRLGQSLPRQLAWALRFAASSRTQSHTPGGGGCNPGIF